MYTPLLLGCSKVVRQPISWSVAVVPLRGVSHDLRLLRAVRVELQPRPAQQHLAVDVRGLADIFTLALSHRQNCKLAAAATMRVQQNDSRQWRTPVGFGFGVSHHNGRRRAGAQLPWSPVAILASQCVVRYDVTVRNDCKSALARVQMLVLSPANQACDWLQCKALMDLICGRGLPCRRDLGCLICGCRIQGKVNVMPDSRRNINAAGQHMKQP